MRKTDANVQAVKRTMTEARTGLERRAGTKVAEKKFFRMRAKENLALEASDLLGEVLTQQSTSHLQQIYPINSTSPTYKIVKYSKVPLSRGVVILVLGPDPESDFQLFGDSRSRLRSSKKWNRNTCFLKD